MLCEHSETQEDTLGSLHSLSPNMWLIQHFQLLEDGNAVSCLTSVLICAGMLTNSGFEANAVKFSTASIKGAVAILHLLRFSSEKSPSSAWKWNQDWALSEWLSLVKLKEDGLSLPSFKLLFVYDIWKLLHKQGWCKECDLLGVCFFPQLVTDPKLETAADFLSLHSNESLKSLSNETQVSQVSQDLTLQRVEGGNSHLFVVCEGGCFLQMILKFFSYFCFKQTSNILLSFSPKSTNLSHNLRINISPNEIRLEQLMASRRVQNCEFSMASQVLFLFAWKNLPPTKLLARIWKIKGYY